MVNQLSGQKCPKCEGVMFLNQDKDYLLEVFSDLILMQQEDEEDEMINKASSLL